MGDHAVTTKRTVTVDEDRWARLKQIAEREGRPLSELAQEGIDVVLDLAEKQQNTIERTVARLESEHGSTEQP